jgi:hypothetical protein
MSNTADMTGDKPIAIWSQFFSRLLRNPWKKGTGVILYLYVSRIFSEKFLSGLIKIHSNTLKMYWVVIDIIILSRLNVNKEVGKGCKQ